MIFRLFLILVVVATTVSAQPREGIYNRHQRRSVTVAVSPDNSLIAVARSSGGGQKRYSRVELWDPGTGELLRTITGFDGPIWSMTFTKDGRSLITLSTEYHDEKVENSVRGDYRKVLAELKWWNVATGEFIKRLPFAEEGVFSVEATWSPDGGAFVFIERYTRSQLTHMSFPGQSDPLSFRSGLERVEEVNLKLLDAETAQRKVKVEDVQNTYYGRLAGLFARLQSPVFSPDGKMIAAISGEQVVVWDVATGKKMRTLKNLNGLATAIAFSPDNKFVAVASTKGDDMPGGESEIAIRDVATGKSVNKLTGKNDVIACVQFVDRGQAILMGTLEYKPNLAMGTVKLWDMRDNRLRRVEIHEGVAVSSMTPINNQRAVLVKSGDEVEIRDARTWRVVHSFAASDDDKAEALRRSRMILNANRAVAVAFSRDGTTVSAEIPGEGIRRWDARTGGMRDLIPHAKSADDKVLAFSSDGDFVVETDAEGVRLRNLRNGTTKLIPVDADDPVSALTLSPDNRTLITADESGVVYIWDVETGQSRKTFQVGQQITGVAIDASGRLLATARADRSIVLWDLKTGAVRSEFRKHENVVNALAFSPDGTMLASGGDDRTAILWELASGKAKRTLKGHDMTVTSLAFSPDGQTLASGTGNTSVVLWNVTTGKLDRILL